MLPGGRGIDGLDRLDVRLVALLGLALLPIGLIAMVQTYRVIDTAESVARAALTGNTLAAVNSERETLVQMRGAAQIAAGLIPSTLDDPVGCSRDMVSFTEEFPKVSFAGYIDRDGIVVCGSTGVGSDVSDRAIFQRFQEDGNAFFAATLGMISRRAVVVVVQPVFLDGERQGYFALSIPQLPLQAQREEPGAIQPQGTITLTADGDVLSLSKFIDIDDLSTLLPESGTLLPRLGAKSFDFHGRSRSGTSQIYTVVPMVPGEIYALSIWRPDTVSTGRLTAASAILFPLLMWLVSIGVAYFAVHRLVVRHIRMLRLRIRAFTTARRILPHRDGADLPSELREVVEAFEQLTERIVRDEADLENSLHEKDVLLKEVHHRVKNNLQLISSMMNMQLRKSRSDETKAVLRRLQDRVLGLATIHRNLYRANVLSRVDSTQLIVDLVSQIVKSVEMYDSAVDLRTEIDPVALYPDQAVPLSLLVTEALTNALKYVGKPKEGNPWVHLTLTHDGNGRVDLRCANSLGTRVVNDNDSVQSGLGTQLMTAFIMQLDGKMRVEQTDESYALLIGFNTSQFTNEH